MLITMEMEIFLFQIVVLIFSVVAHEVSHGAVAYALGDRTAKNAGRLTLNPIPHIDMLGSLILPLLSYFAGGIIIGWAKPVPVNPFNFKDQKYGELKVALAGPISNFTIAIAFGLLLRFGATAFNMPAMFALALALIVQMNIMLGIFNLLPLPPLDGSHIFFAFLPQSMNAIKAFLLRYGYFILLFFIFFLSPIISSMVRFLFRFIVGVSV